jgi:hypothetical protein
VTEARDEWRWAGGEVGKGNQKSEIRNQKSEIGHLESCVSRKVRVLAAGGEQKLADSSDF